MRVLIVDDGTQRGALAAVRALGAAGLHVGVGAPRRGLASRSRWCRRTHAVPHPSQGDAAEAVARATREGGYDVVFPVGDAELLSLSLRRDALGAAFPFGPHASLLSALDKTSLSELADARGIAVPRTRSASDAAAIPEGGVYVKERVHGAPAEGPSAPRTAARHARSLAEAQAAIAHIRDAGGEPVLQEAIRGDLIAYCVLRTRDGRVVSEVQQRAEALFPEGAGVSVRARTVAVDPVLAAAAARLLDELQLWGVAELQFIAPPEGEPRLIDVNPRFYGSLALAERAGAGFAAGWAQLALGRAVDQRPPARVGVRYQWLEGDLRRGLARRKGRTGEVVRSLAYAPGAVHSIWSLSDPAPGALFAGALARRGLGKMAAWK